MILTQENKDQIDEYIEYPQDWDDEYWKDEKRIEMYLKAINAELDIFDGDRYVHLYDVFGIDIGVDVFLDLDHYMYEDGWDIIEIQKGNDEYEIAEEWLKKHKII